MTRAGSLREVKVEVAECLSLVYRCSVTKHSPIILLYFVPGEQTQVSVSGRTSVTKSISSEHPPEIHTPTPQENNVFDPEEEG